MAIANNNVALNTSIQGEFGGANPTSLSEYYKGGTIVGPQPIDPNGIPTSGPIAFSDFIGATIKKSITAQSTGWMHWQADTGWAIDIIDNKVIATLGYWSNVHHGSADPNQLRLANANSDMSTWQEVAQVTLAVPNQIYYGYRENLIKIGGVWYQGQGLISYGENGWIMGARWNGDNTVTIFMNPVRYGTGDTGTSITMSNLGATFERAANTDSDGSSTSYTFAFR